MDVALTLLSFFPQLVGDEENQMMFNEITKEELQAVLCSFQWDKSHEPNGWSTKFYEGFFDLLGDDLLRVVEEICIFGKVLGSINSNFIALIPKADQSPSFDVFRHIALLIVYIK
jgi:hypothetical protein